ncbi:pilus assembly protein [Syntrophobacter fumaroxidans MPOB]|uniref:Pilus assembly protein n=2 Tax=Syntrophobacter TaxID=29526 RepID=A0LLD4_SYNFM|nr:pilus assembly protein [Syntrophobacter fumaroxidans MPOB]
MGMNGKPGFTLVELMVVTAIVAILAAVATPAYINHQNRARQTEAVEALLRARMDQESFWAENNHYANTIGCLYSFGATPSKTAWYTSDAGKGYVVTTTTILVTARRTIPTTGASDVLTLTVAGTERYPTVSNPAATKFSLFTWLFK